MIRKSKVKHETNSHWINQVVPWGELGIPFIWSNDQHQENYVSVHVVKSQKKPHIFTRAYLELSFVVAERIKKKLLCLLIPGTQTCQIRLQKKRTQILNGISRNDEALSKKRNVPINYHSGQYQIVIDTLQNLNLNDHSARYFSRDSKYWYNSS